MFSFASLLLLTKVIVSRFFRSSELARWCLHTFLSKVMQKDILTICVIKVEDAVVPGAKLPYIIFQIFCNLARQSRSVACQKIDIKDDLFILNARIFVRPAFSRNSSRKFHTSDVPFLFS